MPANVPQAITVAASNLPSKFSSQQRQDVSEDLYRWGNTGACVDVFAPGVDIYAACGSAGALAAVVVCRRLSGWAG